MLRQGWVLDFQIHTQGPLCWNELAWLLAVDHLLEVFLELGTQLPQFFFFLLLSFELPVRLPSLVRCSVWLNLEVTAKMECSIQLLKRSSVCCFLIICGISEGRLGPLVQPEALNFTV